MTQQTPTDRAELIVSEIEQSDQVQAFATPRDEVVTLCAEMLALGEDEGAVSDLAFDLIVGSDTPSI